MAEYIEREETCGDCIHADICKDVVGSWFSRKNIAYCKTFKPAADVVPVVRCKDCKRCMPTNDGFVCNHALPTKSLEQYFQMGTDIMAIVKPDDFCSYGERKDGDG